MTDFLFCGEELTNKTARTLKERFPNATIWNTYGPTEATVAITKVEITNEILEEYPRLPIGVAKSDIEIQILDNEGNLLPANETGEIVLIGASVSKGYFKNEEKTEQAFYKAGERQAYRTGDAGFLDEKGQLFYRGRMDFQVKLNGYRIEIQDIESHLLQVPLVKQAVVLPEMQDFKVKRLAAVVVAGEHEFEKEFQLTKAIQQDLRERVMDYMVPARFIYVEEFPLTQNGKIDRKALERGVL
jgi:D-alanine--poly(phosphoribitol) ligase subunit 1